jgi:hypothetical protein
MDAVSLSRGLVTLVDASVATEIRRLVLSDGTEFVGCAVDVKWYAQPMRNTLYAVCAVRRGSGYVKMQLHRLLMEAPRGSLVDHRDGDGLNNRLGNLRLADIASNGWNADHPRAKNRFRGVYQCHGKYIVQFQHRGATIRLGTFSVEEDAARAYDKAISKYRGEFARLNFAQP